MDNAELLRYNRQILLPEIDIDGQEKLLASTVAIIGLGGLGAPVAIYLASAGIGHLILVDDDVVEETNLQRQIVHFESNLQESKVSSAAQTVRLINSSIKITQIDHRLSVADYLDLLSSVDVAIDATDNADSRYTLNKACLDSKVPLVSGAAVRMEGQVAVFDSTSPDSPCYGCLYKDIDDDALNCAENGVASPVVGIIGTIQAMETIKILIGFGETLAGYVLYLDAKRMDLRKFRLEKDPTCPYCGSP